MEATGKHSVVSRKTAAHAVDKQNTGNKSRDTAEHSPPHSPSRTHGSNPHQASSILSSPSRKTVHNLEHQTYSMKHQDQTEQRISNTSKSTMKSHEFSTDMIHVDIVTSFKSRIDVASITAAGNSTAWVMYHLSDTMYLYDGIGELLRSVTVKKGVGINDMVISSTGEVIVANRDQKVRCVSEKDEVSILIDTAPLNVFGVCYTERGEIVVCMSSQVERNHVAVYSSDGRQKLREISGNDAQGNTLITDPSRIVQNGKDLCVVNVGVSEYVVCVDERDEVRWVYDGTQAKLKHSFSPHGICRDKHHNLLITDYNNDCVHYINRDGHLIRIILTREQTKLQYHFGISVDDKTGQVWVGNENKDVVVAKYLHI